MKNLKFLTFTQVNSVLWLFTILAIAACDPGNEVPDRPCTTEYRTLAVTVCDSSSHPVFLDSCYVRKVNTGEIVDFSGSDRYLDSIGRIQGRYLIGSDGKMALVSPTGIWFEFHGLISGVEVAERNYLVGYDGCHVVLMEGNPVIIVKAVP
ncbi:MAG TPA: hypothetical protein PKN44_15045 [Bacteroidales bacterium]|nr:hypothetical protein [Bacteroidales bacterium]